MSRLLAAQRAFLVPAWGRDLLYRRAGAVPSLDIWPAANKTLADITTGQNLVTFTRASSATYIDSDGAMKVAAVDVPRIDHDPVTGECLGLLIEEQRTNLLVPSEDFGTNWGLAIATRTLDVGTAPNGTLTADRVESTGGGVFRSGVGVANATAYTYSVFLKHVSGTGIVSNVGFERFGATPLAAQSSFNVQTGVIVSNGASVAASSITAFGNGWYRVTVTAISTDTTTTVTNYASTSGNQFLIWGAQLEAGAFATSYIPTTSSAATRDADIASISGSNFSSWYRQDEGTFYVKGAGQISRHLMSVDDGTVSNRIQISVGSNAAFEFYTIVAGAATNSFSGASIPSAAGIVGRGALALASGSVNAAISGTLPFGANKTGALPSGLTQMRIGNVGNTDYLNGHIRRLTYWPRRLPNSILQTLTQ